MAEPYVRRTFYFVPHPDNNLTEPITVQHMSDGTMRRTVGAVETDAGPLDPDDWPELRYRTPER